MMQYFRAPNFITAIERPFVFFETSRAYIWWYLGFIFAFLFTVELAPIVALGIFIFLLVPLYTRHTEWGVYTLALLAPLIGWELALYDFAALRSIPVLGGLNAPVSDFMVLALIATTAWGALIGRIRLSPRRLRVCLILGALYGVFLLTALVPFFSPASFDVSASLRYWMRPLGFVFVGYVLLPLILIRTRETLTRVIHIVFWVSAAVGLAAALGLLSIPIEEWVRIVPLQLGSFAPLGHNHTALAALLAIGVPIGVYLYLEAAHARKRHATHLLYMTLGLTFVLLLTLSRAGWIVLAVEALLLAFVSRRTVWFRQIFVQLRQWLPLIIPVGLAIVVYMGVFLTSNTVASSNIARIEQTNVARFYIEQAPWFGYGAGTFVPMLEQTGIFVFEFGDPLDAHGILQKLLFEYGIVGTFFFFFFVLFVLWYALRAAAHLKKRDAYLVYILMIVLIGSVTFQLFDTSYFNPHMWLPIGLLATAVVTLTDPV